MGSADQHTGSVTGRPTRRAVLAAGLLGSLAAAVSACSKGADAASGGLSTGPDLVFGACLELTGAASVVGTAQRNALQVAVESLNATGVQVGTELRKVNLIVKDNASDPASATMLAQQMIESDKVTGLLGGGIAATAIAMAAVAEQRQVPLLATTAAETVIQPATSRRFVFKLGPNAADVMGVMTTQLAKLNLTRIGLLVEASDHGDAGLAAVTAAAKTNGLKLVHTERLPIGVQDYHNEAARVVAAAPDAVIVWAVSPASGLAGRALKDAAFNGPLFFDSGAASDDALSAANRPAMVGNYLVTPRIIAGNTLGATTPAALRRRDFFDQYTRLYGTFSVIGVYAADALNLLTAAATRGEDSTPLRLRNELEATPFEGLAGGYVFSTTQHGGVSPDSLGLYQLDRTGWLQIS